MEIKTIKDVELEEHFGQLVASRFKEDGNWYRGRIDQVALGSVSKVCRIFYIDFGTVEVGVQSEDLRKLSEEFKQLKNETFRGK